MSLLDRVCIVPHRIIKTSYNSDLVEPRHGLIQTEYNPDI